MTRIEAFVALFGTDGERTATAEAVKTIISDPRPSDEEKRQIAEIEIDAADLAADFANDPNGTWLTLNEGKRKDLLTPVAASMSRKSKTPAAKMEVVDASLTTPTPKAESKKPVSRSSDPRDHLYGSPSPKKPVQQRRQVNIPVTSTQSADLEPSDPRPQTTDPLHRSDDVSRNSSRDSRRNRDDDRDDREKKPKDPIPQKPMSPITAVVRERIIQGDPNWGNSRNQIIAAHKASDHERLKIAKSIAATKCDGEHGADGQLFGSAMKLLIKDLEEGLLASNPSEFRARYY